MQKFPPFSAIILDMDGLVLDTEVTYCIAWQQATQQLGFKLSDDFFRQLAGLPFQEIEKRLQQACNGQLSLEKFRKLSGDYWYAWVEKNGIAKKLGLMQLLQVIEQQQLPFGLATNSALKNTLYCLKMAGLENVFPHIICGDQVTSPKPAADIFYQAAKLLNQPIQRCLVVEDSATGIQAALNAGAIPVLINSVNFQKESCYYYSNLAQLADCLKI